LCDARAAPRGLRLKILALALAVVVAAIAGSADASSPRAPLDASKRCKKGYRHKIVRHRHVCVRIKKKQPAPKPVARIAGTFGLDGTALDLESGAGSLWVRVNANASGDAEEVQRIDPATGQTVARIQVGEGIGLGVGEGAVWAPNTAGTLSRVDVATNSVVATIALPTFAPYDAATTPGAVWVTALGEQGLSGSIAKVDPATDAVAANLTLPGATGAFFVAAGAGGVWVNTETGLVRIDPTTSAIVATVGTRFCEGGIAADATRVWTTLPCGARSGQSDSLFAVDPARNAIVARTFRDPLRAVDVAVGLGSVWVMTGNLQPASYLVSVNGETARERGRLRIPTWGPVEAQFGSVWVAAGNRLLRIQPQP
jgi:hypothetical protein